MIWLSIYTNAHTTNIVTLGYKEQVKIMFKKSKPLKNPDDFHHGYEYALFLLNLSMRAVGDLREKMTTRGYTNKVIDEVINNLLEQRYVGDENYAEVFINSMKNYKTWGRFMMKKKLIEKKLDKPLIEQKLDEMVSEDDEVEIALRYLKREFGDKKEIKKLDYENKQKIMRRLAGRGFGMGVIQKIIN